MKHYTRNILALTGGMSMTGCNLRPEFLSEAHLIHPIDAPIAVCAGSTVQAFSNTFQQPFTIPDATLIPGRLV